MKLVIIGNGFDLNHQLETSFSQFREHLLNTGNSEDAELVSNIDSILNPGNKIQLSNLLWNDYEAIMGQKFINGINISSGGLNFFDAGNEFSARFYEYLKLIASEKDSIKNDNIKREIETADCIITFNYTGTYHQYIDTKKNTDVFHIHGTLSDDNLPIIGFFYANTGQTRSLDYITKYKGRGFHKPALALKQNEIDLDKRINEFKTKWQNQFTEIVSIGYSFGKSDSHIFDILDKLMLQQLKDIRIPKSKAETIPIINFKLFNYNQDETNKFKNIIIQGLRSPHKRNTSVKVYGNGHFDKDLELIEFSQIEY